MIPTLGRIVHYCNGYDLRGGVKTFTFDAAIISGVTKKPDLDYDKEKWDSEENAYFVNLHVFTQWGTDVVKNVPFDAKTGDPVKTWCWPPRT